MTYKLTPVWNFQSWGTSINSDLKTILFRWEYFIGSNVTSSTSCFGSTSLCKIFPPQESSLLHPVLNNTPSSSEFLYRTPSTAFKALLWTQTQRASIV